MQKRVPFVHWRTITFGDTDAAAIVYTPNFSNYCMEAAEIWFQECLRIDWYLINTNFGMGTPVVHMEIDFISSLKSNDLLGVKVEVERIGKSTITLVLKGERKRNQENELVNCFNAKFIFCFTSLKANGAIPIPNEQVLLLNNYKSRGYEAFENIR